ncbi:MAG: hypothetical protein QOJ69_466 [Actinomycetota bacterium]|nr:hypothetical protein [Actinomycetota bacterium]
MSERIGVSSGVRGGEGSSGGRQPAPDPAPGPPSVRPQSVADRSPYRGRTLAPVEAPARPASKSEPEPGVEPDWADAGPRATDELFARLRDQVPEPQQAAGDNRPSPAGENRPAVEHRPDPVLDETALTFRDQLLDPIDADLTRALKRVLQDEQNEALDRLRQVRGRPSVADLPGAEEQSARLIAVAAPLLATAHGAGGGSGSEAAGGRLAEGLALDLVRPLRERLERAIGTVGDDPDELAEALRTSYRQCKLQEIEPAVRHYTAAAHAVGAFSAMADGMLLRWVVDDDGPCPDCDDNTLAGPTPKGTAFPTGQHHPPAHSGCRCLLVPVAT